MSREHEVACRCPSCDRRWQTAYKEVSDNGKALFQRIAKIGPEGKPWERPNKVWLGVKGKSKTRGGRYDR